MSSEAARAAGLVAAGRPLSLVLVLDVETVESAGVDSAAAAPLVIVLVAPAVDGRTADGRASGEREQLDACRRRFGTEPTLFLTGGDACSLLNTLPSSVTYWPEMTLEGIRRTAEALA